MMLVRVLLALAIALGAVSAHAQFDDWKQRSRFAIDTTATGVPVKSALQQFVVPVRLHTGNFDFRSARPDGADLRFVAADGKTALVHRLESFDPTNELAVAWVQLPTLAPGAKDSAIYVLSGNPKAEAPSTAPLHDARTQLALHFGAQLRNEAGDGVTVEAPGAVPEPLGIAGAALRLGPGGRLTAEGAGLRFGADGTTLMAWVRPGAADATGRLLTMRGTSGFLVEVSLARGIPTLSVTGGTPAAGAPSPGAAPAQRGAPVPLTASGTAPLAAAQWRHLAVVAGERVALFVDGAEVAAVPVRVGDQPLALALGGGAAVDVDELTVAGVARSPEYLRTSFASQGPEAALFALADEGGEANYMAILIDNLTIDGEIAIYVLGAMFVVAVWVIVAKAIQLSRAARANARFIAAFRQSGDEAFLAPAFGTPSIGAAATTTRFDDSPLYAMFQAASQQVRQRVSGGSTDPSDHRGAFGDKAMNSIRAAIDATAVRETNRLNRLIVLLTIAISGGPFIGLLGTVVGVMITFAAIAAIGDVNINSIAPGIAAALLATVAGLVVAIPALFAYNWLASRIKELTSEMAIFGDELVSRIAEAFER